MSTCSPKTWQFWEAKDDKKRILEKGNVLKIAALHTRSLKA